MTIELPFAYATCIIDKRESERQAMNDRERALVFESALEDYRAGLHAVAARTLDQLVEDGSVDPLHLSYCGLLRAMTEGGSEASIELCRRAVAGAGRVNGELYLNLARVLAASGRRREAIEALDEATSWHPTDTRLRQELRHLVPRAKPIFRSLPRAHPLNKYMGIARTVGGRLWVTFLPRVKRVSPRDRPGGGAATSRRS